MREAMFVGCPSLDAAVADDLRVIESTTNSRIWMHLGVGDYDVPGCESAFNQPARAHVVLAPCSSLRRGLDHVAKLGNGPEP